MEGDSGTEGHNSNVGREEAMSRDYYQAVYYEIDPDPTAEPLVHIGSEDIGFATEDEARSAVEAEAKRLGAEYVLLDAHDADPDLNPTRETLMEEWTYSPGAGWGKRY